MTAIMDAVNSIHETVDILSKELKEDKCLSPVELDFIRAEFHRMAKEANDTMEKVKGLFSARKTLNEDEQLSLLESLSQVSREDHESIVRFQSGYAQLKKRRLAKLQDAAEVAGLFAKRKRDENEKVVASRCNINDI